MHLEIRRNLRRLNCFNALFPQQRVDLGVLGAGSERADVVKREGRIGPKSRKNPVAVDLRRNVSDKQISPILSVAAFLK